VRRALRGLLALVLACGLVVVARAQSSAPASAAAAWVKPAAITVVTDDNYPPYVFRDDEGVLQGLLPDLWAAWAEQTGVQVKLLGMDWGKAQQTMQSGQADVIDTMFETAARRKLYDFSAPWAQLEVPLFFHKTIGGITDADSVRGFTVGVKAGDACIDTLRAHGVDTLREFPSYPAVIDAAAKGDVKVFCVDKPPAVYLLQKKGLDADFRHSVPLSTGEFHRAVHKGQTALLALLEQGFRDLPAAQRQRMDDKWFGTPLSGGAWWAYARWGGGALGLVALVVLTMIYWNLALRRRVQAKTTELSASVQALETARGLTQNALDQLQATLAAIPDLLFELDEDGVYLDFRAARLDLLVVPPEQFLGRRLRETMPAQAAEIVHRALDEARQHGLSSGAQMRLDLAGGEFWFELSVAVKRGQPGQGDHFIVLSRDISDRKRAEAALAQRSDDLERRVQERSRDLVLARDEAQRASLAKSEFLSRMSHELRTPMNAILGFSQLLMLDTALAERPRGQIGEIYKAGQHLLQLINEVLDLAQVESGRMTLSAEPVQLDVLVHEVQMLLQPVAEQAGVSLRSAALAGCVVRADRTRLKQVLLNLLGNAIKYNRPGGSVAVAVERLADAAWRVSVTDDGVGIAPDRLSQLFEPFNRLGAEGGLVQGTGIGLSISRRLVELMHGQIGASSRLDHGSVFWVDLPTGEFAVGTGAVAEWAGPAGRSAIAPSPAGAAAPATVLYVEDNPANRDLVVAILARHPGLRLLTADTARQGLTMALAERPQLILLDIHLPDMDGYAVLKALRNDLFARDIPVVAITANAMPDDVLRAKTAGFDDYLPKPIDLGAFEAMLAERLGSRPS
jgi:two-component system, sensor histidine kinase and response regulator